MFCAAAAAADEAAHEAVAASTTAYAPGPMFFCPSIFRMTQLGSLGYAAMNCQTVFSGKKGH